MVIDKLRATDQLKVDDFRYVREIQIIELFIKVFFRVDIEAGQTSISQKDLQFGKNPSVFSL